MTAQFHEILIKDGKKEAMAFCPPIPANNPGIIRLEREEVKDAHMMIFSSACWRNYVGTWEIKDGKFYLVDIEGIYKITGDSPIFAEWFTDIIRISQGKLLLYEHQGFESIYEKDEFISIEKGIVKDSTIVDNREKYKILFEMLEEMRNNMDNEPDKDILDMFEGNDSKGTSILKKMKEIEEENKLPSFLRKIKGLE